MVRRDVIAYEAAIFAEAKVTRSAFSVGASPTPVGVGAPGSRPQI